MGNKVSPAAKAVALHLSEAGIKYATKEPQVYGEELFFFTMSGKKGSLNIEFTVRAKKTPWRLTMYSRYPLNVPPQYLSSAIDFVTTVNYSTILGNYEIDMRDGEIRFKTAVLCTQQSIGSQIGDMVSRNLQTADKYYGCVTSIITTGTYELPKDEKEDKILGMLQAFMKDLFDQQSPNSTEPKDSEEEGEEDKLDDFKRKVVENVNTISHGDRPPSAPGSPDGAKERPSESPARIGDMKVINHDEIKYQKKDKLGEGGFAKVYKGKWLGGDVAIKRIKGELAKDALEAFAAEMSVMASLHHPNIVLFMGITQEPPCIITEYMPKKSLQNVIDKEYDQVGWPLRISILMDIALGMNYIHNCSIVHGDLKPLNVLLDDFYKAKIADFGLAQAIQTTLSTCVKAQGFSIAYAAPEVFEGRARRSSDVYSFAIVMWQVATGQTPYLKQKLLAVEIQNAVKAGKHLLELPSTSPGKYNDLMKQCWQFKHESRPTFHVIGETLQEIATSKTWETQ